MTAIIVTYYKYFFENAGTTTQLPVLQFIGIISPVVAAIAFVLLTSFIVMTCWIRRHSKGKGTCAHTQNCYIDFMTEFLSCTT